MRKQGLLITICIVLLLGYCQSLSDKRLCADENCREIISLGTGKISYPAGEEGMVSFKINSPIRIKSKSAGKDPSLWGVEVNGREGFAPKEFIRETKIYINEKDLKFEVDVRKPSEKEPVLSTSEGPTAKVEPVETTTTKPLDFIPTEAVEKPSTITPIEITKVESTTVTSPEAMELVDGTQIPKLDDLSNQPFESKDVIGDNDKDNEEENNNDVLQTEQLEEYSNTKSEENTLPKFIEQENKQAEQEAKGQIEVEENSLISNIHSVHNEKSLKILKENEIVSKSENTETQVLEAKLNIEEKIISNYSSTQSTQPENQEQIFESENDKKLQEPAENHSKENEKHRMTDEYKPENEVKEGIANNETEAEDLTLEKGIKETPNELEKAHISFNTNVVKSTEPSNYISDNSTLQESSSYHGNESYNENKIDEIKDLMEANEPQSEKFEKNFMLKDTSNSENAVDSNIESDLTEANVNFKSNSDIGNNVIDSFKSSENVTLIANDSNTVDKSNDSNDFHTVDESITAKEQEISYTTSISSQMVIEESTNEINEISKEHKIDHEKEENAPQKKEAIVTTSSNTFTEPLASVHLPSQNDNNKDLHLSSLTEEVPHNSFYEHHQSTYYDTEVNVNSHDNENTIPSSAKVHLSSQNDDNKDLHLSSLTKETPYNTYYDQHQSAYYDTEVSENSHVNENTAPNGDTVDESNNKGYTNAEPLLSDFNMDTKNEEKQTKAPAAPSESFDIKENKGLFATIMSTVNGVLSINKIKQNENEDKSDLDRILFSKIGERNKLETENEDFMHCTQIGPNGECPIQEQQFKAQVPYCDCSTMDTVFNYNLTFDAFINAMAAKILDISEVLVFLVIVAAASLFFIFGYYCFCNSSREGALLSKLNQLESSLLASQKENAILKHNLLSVRQKLTSIEDNSFGSNDMVVSLKKELEEELLEKARLQDQITALQKELENAADAGIELNKIVSELLTNQTGDESIISSVEELQKQLNEQQNTILEINTSLAEKSRENSELQLLLAEQNARYESELAILQRDNDELEHEKGNLMSRLDELKSDFDRDITTALEGKNLEIRRLQSDILELNNKVENEHTKWQTSLAKVEALEECLKNVRKDPSIKITELIDVANVKAQLIEAQRKYKSIKEKLESEVDSRKLAENQLQIVSAEVEKLKQDFNQSEKDKLEAQTRLEVLSNYFKEKENQLQKELNLKEAMWLQQQGETTTTVDRLTAMQEEIQSLKSQNDSLRAEIEAQIAAHKAQIGTLENRAHETWLVARQSDRRCEEARAEATALRRKLTALAGGNINEGNKTSAGPISLNEDITNVPSPIHMEAPGSPMLGRIPPPPFLPPPFMGPPPPFIGMPPPPAFVPPGEMRPAPLGRIMSPPPQRSGRFSPQHLDYEDYVDYDCNNSWHRHTYSPPPRTYRSLSPTDSRYDYGTERDLMSTYDTETDFSPPPSPREPRRRIGNNSEKSDHSKNTGSAKKFNNKGLLSSGSETSYNSPSHTENKTKKGSTGVKSIV